MGKISKNNFLEALQEASEHLETSFKSADFKTAIDATTETINNLQEYLDYLKKEKQGKKLPETWEELETLGGYFVSECSEILRFENGMPVNKDKNVFPTKEEAQASLALAQLCQLRDRYNAGWKPDWKDGQEIKYCIYFYEDEISHSQNRYFNTTLSFKDIETRDKFLKNFRELIEMAKPLL